MLNYAVRLHEIYNTVLIIPRSARDVLLLIDSLEEIGRARNLSRCVHQITDDLDDTPRCLWAFTCYDTGLLALVEEVLGLESNPHPRIRQ